MKKHSVWGVFLLYPVDKWAILPKNKGVRYLTTNFATMPDLEGSVLGTISFTGDASEETSTITTGVDEVTTDSSEATTDFTTQETSPEVEETPTTEEETKDNESLEAKEIAKKYEALRKLQIDHIEEKLEDYQKGKISSEDLKRWFDSDATRADIANTAMRVKPTYRKFVKSYETTTTPTASQEAVPIPSNIDELIEQKVQEKIGKIEAEKMQKIEEDYSKTFAGKMGVKDDQYYALTNNAKALRTANPGWTQEQALQASYHVLYPAKRSSVFVPSQPGASPAATEEVVDLTKGFTIGS